MHHLVAIDGHHLMYRAYWAIPRTLSTSVGEQVNAVFGMASMLLHILKQEKPSHLVICFDAGEETFRHEENETYKEGRAETPDDFYVQIPRILELVEAFGIPHVSNTRFEADDFLCTYARAAEREGMQVTVITGDKDALQLAGGNIRIAIPHSGYTQPEYLGAEEVEAKFGIRPDQVPDFKGLMGDSSDNLPGVKGIGPKTAATLLQEYETLQGIYDHLGDVRPAVREKLERDREQAFFCARMAQLVCDVPLAVSVQQTHLESLPADSLLQFFEEMEFSLLARRFREFLKTPYGAEVFVHVADVFAEPVISDSPKRDQQSLF